MKDKKSESNNKEKSCDKSMKALVLILTLVIVLLGGYIVYDSYYNKNNQNIKTETNNVEATTKQLSADEKFALYASVLKSKRLSEKNKNLVIVKYPTIREMYSTGSWFDLTINRDGDVYADYGVTIYLEKEYQKTGSKKIAENAIDLIFREEAEFTAQTTIFIIFEDGSLGRTTTTEIFEEENPTVKVYDNIKNIIDVKYDDSNITTPDQKGHYIAVDIEGNTFKLD